MVREHEGETTVKRLLIAASLVAMLAFPAGTQARGGSPTLCYYQTIAGTSAPRSHTVVIRICKVIP
jgi:hypothetical protein